MAIEKRFAEFLKEQEEIVKKLQDDLDEVQTTVLTLTYEYTEIKSHLKKIENFLNSS